QGEMARAEAEALAKSEAEQARQAAQRQLIDMATSSGLAAARQKEHAQALLWFARAVELASDEPGRQELNRIRVANWLRAVPRPLRAFRVPDFRPLQGRFRVFELH